MKFRVSNWYDVHADENLFGVQMKRTNDRREKWQHGAQDGKIFVVKTEEEALEKIVDLKRIAIEKGLTLG